MRLLARNAEALFWLARYLERGSSLARVIEMQSAFGGHEHDSSWSWLLALHSDEERFAERAAATSATIVSFFLTDAENPGSVRSSIHWARENARALRPFIPAEMWAQLNTFYGTVQELGTDHLLPSKLPRTCSQIRVGCLAQIGIAEGTLYRDEGYEFFKLGLLIERADQTSRLLDVKFAQNPVAKRTDSSDEFVFWSTILRTAAAYQVFNRLQPGLADPDRVARFLILNPSHPRSIGYCVREIGEALNILRSTFQLARASPCLEDCEKLMEGLQVAGQDVRLSEHLHGFNDWIQRALIELTTHIGAAFFPASPVSNTATDAAIEAPPRPTLSPSEDTDPEGPPSGQSQTQTQHQS